MKFLLFSSTVRSEQSIWVPEICWSEAAGLQSVLCFFERVVTVTFRMCPWPRSSNSFLYALLHLPILSPCSPVCRSLASYIKRPCLVKQRHRREIMLNHQSFHFYPEYRWVSTGFMASFSFSSVSHLSLISVSLSPLKTQPSTTHSALSSGTERNTLLGSHVPWLLGDVCVSANFYRATVH